MGIGSNLFAVLGVVVSTILYTRGDVIKTFLHNSPSRIVELRNPWYSFEHAQISRLRNCEDIYLNSQDKYAIVSCDPARDTWNTVMGTFVNASTALQSEIVGGTSGSSAETGLYLYRYTAPEEVVTKVKLLDVMFKDGDFHPLGIEVTPAGILFAANHAFSGSRLEIFRLYRQDSAATHIKTIEHPLLATPNSILALSETEVLVTNDHRYRKRFDPMLATAETYLGLPLGPVSYVRFDDKFNILNISTVAHMPFPNGIALLNETTVAIASSSTATVKLYHFGRQGTDDFYFYLIKSITLPFIPDNLSVDDNGVLLIAGHPYSPSVTKIAKNAQFCTPEIQASNATQSKWCKDNLRPNYLSWVAEWTHENGLVAIYAGKDDFGTSTTAVRDVDAGVGLVTGLYEQGLLRFTPIAV